MESEIVVVVNKWWEAAPLLGVFQHPDARPKALVDVAGPAGAGPSGPMPRLTAHCDGRRIAVWCVQDLMDPAENSSSTWEKARVLPRAFAGNLKPKLVIAVGTAGCPQGSDHAGSVVAGSSVFVHDPYATPPDPKKHWTDPRINQIIPSAAAKAVDQIAGATLLEVGKRLLTAPLAPAEPPQLEVGSKLVSVGIVNVTNPSDYKWADPQALAKFKAVDPGGTAASDETTHGVIRALIDAPFVYVSGLANAVGKFAEEVVPRIYAQNYVAAHNAGVAVAWLIPELIQVFSRR